MRGRAIGAVLAALAGLVLTAGSSLPARATIDIDTFHGQSPQRVLDTRPGGTTADTGASGTGAVGPGATIDVPLAGRGGVPAAGAGAVALNVTVTGAAAGGYLTVWPAGATRPTASNLNFVAGQTVPNVVIVKVGAGGAASIFNGGTSDVHVIADVLGWFPTGDSFHGLTPARLLDTRPAAPTTDAAGGGGGPVAGGAAIDVDVAGRGGVPPTAGAVALNVTAVDAAAAGYLTVWPSGASRPTASTLNFGAGQAVPNMVVVPLGAGGRVSVFNGAGGAADVIVDVLGWFPTGDSFHGLTPARLMDTRDGAATIDTRYAGGRAVGEALHQNLVVAGRGGVPLTAGAVALNVTVTDPNRPGYLTIKPQGAVTPTASNLNFEPGQTVANMVLVPLGGSGEITIVITDGAPNEFLDAETEVIVDVLGWFPNPTDPPTTYGTDLVLRADGVGPAGFGDAAAPTLVAMIAGLGPPVFDDLRAYPIPAGERYEDPDTGDSFTHPVGRVVCWAGDAFCALFGGASATTLGFVGWNTGTGDAGTRLIDANGLGLNTRGSDIPGAIATIHEGGCYAYGTGVAASGISLGLVSDGSWFATFGPAGEDLPQRPGQHEVVVEQMSAGAEILVAEGDC